MFRRTYWIFLLLCLVPYRTFAQPPQDLPPPLPGNTTKVQAAPAPVATPKVDVPKPVTPSANDKVVQGVKLSPSVTLYPFGFDSINLGSKNNEGGRYYFSIKPGVNLATAFRTATDKTFNFSISYTFEWREYYNKETSRRDFGNFVISSASIPWTDRISTTLPLFFLYFFKTGSDLSYNSILIFDNEPQLNWTLNDKWKFNLGFWVGFVNYPTHNLDPVESPSNPEDFQQGFFWDVFPESGTTSSFDLETIWDNAYGTSAKISYTPIKGTTLNFYYRYVFLSFSNTSDDLYKAHFITPSISQSLPWGGGTISLTNELRLKKQDELKIFDGSPKQTLRNRVTISISQAINSYMTWEGYYRLNLYGSNDNDYTPLFKNHHLYTGVSFKF